MRVVYLGTSAFAAGVLQGLVGCGVVPVLVVTRPDRPAGRGRKLTPPPVAVLARDLGLEVDQPDDVNTPEVRARIAAAQPDDVVLCAFGALVREPLLSDHEILNVHPSLLPRWRGAAPMERAIMAGDAETGVAIMRLVAELDAGPVCAMEPVAIAPEDDFASLSAKLIDVAVALLLAVLDHRPPWVEQPGEGVTYAEKLVPEDRTLDLARPARVNADVVRALRPHVGARVRLADGSFLGVVRAHAEDDALVLDEVQPPGGRPMSYTDYVRGHGEPSLV